MSMTRKDYEMIADVLNRHAERQQASAVQAFKDDDPEKFRSFSAAASAIDSLTHDLARTFHAENERFSIPRFVDAASVTD